MGQAKRRGTFEERLAQALARQQKPVEPLRPIPPVVSVPRVYRKHPVLMGALLAAMLPIPRQ